MVAMVATIREQQQATSYKYYAEIIAEYLDIRQRKIYHES